MWISTKFQQLCLLVLQIIGGRGNGLGDCVSTSRGVVLDSRNCATGASIASLLSKRKVLIRVTEFRAIFSILLGARPSHNGTVVLMESKKMQG